MQLENKVKSITPRRQAAKERQVLRVAEDEVARVVVDAAYKVFMTLGPGLLESVYQVALAHELEGRGRRVRREVAVPVQYGEMTFQVGFRADMLVDEIVIVELKSVEHEMPVHKRQLLTYVRLTNLRLGLLLNFGAWRFKNVVSRVANGMPE